MYASQYVFDFKILTTFYSLFDGRFADRRATFWEDRKIGGSTDGQTNKHTQRPTDQPKYFLTYGYPHVYI